MKLTWEDIQRHEGNRRTYTFRIGNREIIADVHRPQRNQAVVTIAKGVLSDDERAEISATIQEHERWVGFTVAGQTGTMPNQPINITVS